MKSARLMLAKGLGGALLLSLTAGASAAIGCSDTAVAAPEGGDRGAPAAMLGRVRSQLPSDPEGALCLARAAVIEGEPELPGSPAFDAKRIEILGRSRGEPLVLVREPFATPERELPEAWRASRLAFERGRPGARVHEVLRRHRRDPRALRALLLREGYAFSTDPLDALAMITTVFLSDLFDEPEIWLQRGAEARRLRREERRGEIAYLYVDGPSAGRAADLLFGDRAAVVEGDLAGPLHRDMLGLAGAIGFDRARITRRTAGALLAELRFGSRWVRAVLEAEGAALRLGCIAEEKAVRDDVSALRAAGKAKLRALERMHEVVSDQVSAAIRFDRPEGEKTADRDGQLRPVWATAYFQGRSSFDFEGTVLPVFDAQGHAWPPQVCVDFVLDTFERASGTWFRPQGEAPARARGRLDFNEVGIPNRRAVLAFADFAEEQPDLFKVRRFKGEARVPFGDRSRFFAFLLENADEVAMGDVVAIHGLKRDDRVHQHAILVEYSDPLTGFPYGLADQMKRPRRRTWEGIMAEAPKRSLLYRVRPTDALIERVAGE